MREFFLNPFLLVQQHQRKTQHFLGIVVLTLCISKPVQNTTPKCLCLRVLQHHSSGYRSHLITKVPFTAPFLALLWCYMGSLTMVQALLSLTALGALETAPPQRMEPFGLVITAQHPVVEANRNKNCGKVPKHSQSLTSSRKIWSHLSLFSIHLWVAFTSFNPHFKVAKACTN